MASLWDMTRKRWSCCLLNCEFIYSLLSCLQVIGDYYWSFISIISSLRTLPWKITNWGFKINSFSQYSNHKVSIWWCIETSHVVWNAFQGVFDSFSSRFHCYWCISAKDFKSWKLQFVKVKNRVVVCRVNLSKCKEI